MNDAQSKRSIKTIILFAAMTASLLLVGGSYWFASNVFERLMLQQASQQANTLKQLTFQNMYQIMSQGWTREQLTEFLTTTDYIYQQSGLSIDLYRGKLVSDVYGEIEHETVSEETIRHVQQVFNSAGVIEVATGAKSDNFFPLIAESRCLSCHQQASEGSVLGVMHIHQSLDQLDLARSQVQFFFFLLLPLPILVAWWIARYINRWLAVTVERMQDYIAQISTVRDLSHIKEERLLSEWAEFQPLSQALIALTQKLQTIAVDRDILEFEIRLLDKFIITSEVVRDWKEHVAMLIQEVNKIMPMYALFVVFRSDQEEHFALEIFWAGVPTDKLRTEFEAYARDNMNNHQLLSRSNVVDIHHTVVNQHIQLDYNEAHMEMQTKNLMLETPRIGGVVGIGLQARLEEDLTRSLVIESVLTTLINVVGSIKAINKYTKDLEYYATRDPLTHLYNQRVFRELLDYEIVRADRKDYQFTLLMCDFDNFKFINDQHGHLFGDHMLQTFARTVTPRIGKGDVFARYGGDEFCIIFPDANTEKAQSIANQLIDAIREVSEIAPDGTSAHITCSMGLATFPDHAKTSNDLFLVADNMMYKAKEMGKNQIMTPSHEEVSSLYRQTAQKSNMLMQALEEEALVEPHFQPILNVQTGKVEVHELLMRIRQDDKIVSAGEFIELAERMGIVHKLDYLLIKKAFYKIKTSGYQGKLFINLSPKALLLNEFVDQIKNMAREHGIVPQRIVFEITERDTVQNLTLLERFVRDLKFEGFQFAIDDFGSGFSSFHYLKHFPVDYLKIEGEFISHMTRDYIDRAFVQSAVTLAQAVSIETVAEFVEDAETLQTVRDIGIHYAQGWFISSAQPTFMTETPEVVLAALGIKKLG